MNINVYVGRACDVDEDIKVKVRTGTSLLLGTMSPVLIFGLILLSLTCVTGRISNACLRCICKHETGCTVFGCKANGPNACGYFQIRIAYWVDCGRPRRSWIACARSYSCSANCVRAYMRRYIGPSGCPANCKSYARIHNGGPRGCKRRSTLPYWRGVSSRGCGVHS